MCGKSQTGGRKYVRANRGSKGGVRVLRPQISRKPQWNYDQNTLRVLLRDRQKGHGFTPSLFFIIVVLHMHTFTIKGKETLGFSDKQVLSRLSNVSFILGKAFS